MVGYHYVLIVDTVLGQVDAKHIGNSRLYIVPIHIEGSASMSFRLLRIRSQAVRHLDLIAL